MPVLVINCGSSSIKYKLYGLGVENLLGGGIIEGVGEERPKHLHAAGDREFEAELEVGDYRHGVASIVKALTGWGSPPLMGDPTEIVGVGHRVVHGGDRFSESVVIDRSVIEEVESLGALAPLHNPANLAGIRAARELLPGAVGVAVFDTAFFSTLSPHAYRYAVPERWWRDFGVRRYGFHGISHRYLAQRAARLLETPRPNLVSLHLGAGASACAIRDGKAVDTSMGMTPLEGLVMGTRSGDIDPAVVFHLMEAGLPASEIRRGLQREGGLLGLSGISSDFRLVAGRARAGDRAAALAVETFVHRVRRYLGAFLVQVAPCDGVIFSGGIGENSHEVRQLILSGLETLGLVVDPARNRGEGERRISADTSSVGILVIPTDEESLIARDTARLVNHRRS
ncbi:MAG: acetate/propionate family kinase [Acidimicrobiia bacterium]|nr:acetate/propionate family kinase [Acidimicrobiia bacterium]